jgi:hypothetical protein
VTHETSAPGLQGDIPADWTEHDLLGIRLFTPDAWEVRRDASGDPVAQILAPASERSEFRSNIVVRVSAGPAVPDLAPVASQSLATLAATWQGEGTVVSTDLILSSGHETRVQRFLARAGELEFQVERFLVARPDSVVELTVTIPVADVVSHAMTAEAIVYNADYSATLTGAPGGGPTPTDLPYPALDADLSAASGRSLEDTRRLVADQARSFSLGGPRVSAPVLKFLQETGGSAVGRLAAMSHRETVQELQEAGLLDGRRLTDLALDLMVPHRGQVETLRLFAGQGSTSGTHFHAWLGGDGTALLAVGPPMGDLLAGESSDPQAHPLTLARVDNQSVPRFAAAWLGLGPLWRVDLSDARLTVDELQRASDEGTASPIHTSSPVGPRLSGAPLMDLHVDNARGGGAFSLIHVPGVGHFQPTPVEGHELDGASALRLATVTPREITDVLIALVDRAISTA